MNSKKIISILLVLFCVTNYSFSQTHYKVFVLSGQSNCNGNVPANQIPTEMNKVHSNIKCWIGETLEDLQGKTPRANVRSWQSLAPGWGYDWTGFAGPELSMAYTLAQLYPNDNIAIIKHNRPGQALHSFFRPPSSGGTVGQGYTNIVNTVNTALTSIGGTFEIVGMGWIQGESDMMEGKGDEYEMHLRNFITDLRTAFNAPNMRFAIAQTIPNWGDATQGPLVRNAQQKVANEMQYVGIFDPSPDKVRFPIGVDDNHFVSPGSTNLGIELANILKALENEGSSGVYNVNVQTTAPYWNFTNNLEGWGGANSMNINQSNGVLNCTITGGDPHIWSADNLNFPASVYKYMVLAVQNGTPEVNGELLFSTTDHPNIDGTLQVNMSFLYNDTKIRYYVLDLSVYPQWKGTIKQLRFDPTVANSGTFKIDFIKFVGTPADIIPTIPGIIEAENFNFGGQGNAFNDNDGTNNGGKYRTNEGVDIENTGDATGYFNIGWQNSGEWQEYLINVERTSNYVLKSRVASPTNGNQFHIEIDGANVTGTITVNNTGSVQTYTTLSNSIALTKGFHLMRVFIDNSSGGINTNFYQFEVSDAYITVNNEASYKPNSTITLEASVYNPQNNTAKVEFYNGNIKLGEDVTYPFTYAWGVPAQGNYEITVKALNSSGILITQTTSPIYIGNAKVGIRPLPFDAGSEPGWNCSGCGNWNDNKGKYPYIAQNIYSVMDYTGDFVSKKRFSEYYIETDGNYVNTNPNTSKIIQTIRNAETQGNEFDMFFICRETELIGGGIVGPIPGDSRILFKEDVIAIRKLFKDAYALGLIKKDNYKLVQMVREPDVFYNNAQAIEIISMMDGVSWEAHHFGPGEWFYEKEKLDALVKGIQWTLSHNLDYVFYYGPFRWTNCHDYYDDIYKDWLERLWEAGAPKYANKMHYYLNAFPFGCGASRKVGPETDPYSIAGETKWLIEQVSGTGTGVVNPPTTTNYWHFTSTIENWSGINQMSLSVSNSIATATITGADPYMHSPDNLNISATDYKYVVVSLKNNTASTKAELFWTTTASTNFEGAKMVQFSITPTDAKQRYYIIDLSTNPNWAGTIKQIRLDPTTTVTSGTVEIDFIKFVGTYPSLPIAIPGTVEFEHYNKGGEGNAYHDNDAANNGGAFRTTEGVDIQGCSEGGYANGWSQTGEWTEYLVNVETTGTYTFTLRAASISNGNQFHIEIDGENVSGVKTVNTLGGLQDYFDVTSDVELSAGKHILKFYFDNATGGINVNKMVFVKKTTTTPPSGNSKQVGIAYDTWFLDNGSWNCTWGTPALGIYNSDNIAVIDQHIEWLVDAGVDFIFIDWSNNSDYYPGCNCYWYLGAIEDNTAILVDRMVWRKNNGKSWLKVAIMIGVPFRDAGYHDGTMNRKVNQVKTQYLDNPSRRSVYYEHRGKPLLIDYCNGTYAWTNDIGWNHSQFDNTFTIRHMYAGLGEQNMWNPTTHVSENGLWSWDEKFPPAYSNDGRPECVTVHAALRKGPGTWNTTTSLGRRDGATLRESFGYANTYNVDLALVIPFNEWVGCESNPGEQRNVEFSKDIEPMLGGHGDLYLRIMKEEIYKFKGWDINNPPTTTNPNYWHFTSSMEGWTPINQITATASNSIASATISGADPFMHSPDNLNISATNYKYVVVSMQNQTASTTAELFWTTTSATGFDGAKMVQFPIIANDTKQRTYIIDLSAIANWTGTIKQIRLDPTIASSGTVKIDAIKFVGTYTSSPLAIPGTIQAEDFNKGGQDNAYNDADIANSGSAYRTTEGVDIETTGDATGAYNIGWVAAGEWMEYLVTVSQSGAYNASVRAAAPGNGAALELYCDGDLLSTFTLTNSGAWQTYANTVAQVQLTQGKHILKIRAATSGFNLNSISFIKQQPITITPYTLINAGAWAQTATATLCAGGSVMFGPHPVVETGWTWTGPNGFTANTRAIDITNVSSGNAGNYVATYTDASGNKGTQTFTITVNDLPAATVSTTTASNGLSNGSIKLTFADNPTRTNISFSIDNGATYTSVADNLGTYTFTAVTAGKYKVYTRWGNADCPVYLGEYTVPASLQITLVKGWNLISTNLHPADSTIETLFAGLDVAMVKDMNGFWKKGQIPAFNSLKTITAGNGYLVNMNTAGTLTISGTPMLFSNFQIGTSSNWYLIGYPGCTDAMHCVSTPISNYFNATNCQTIKNFDGFWVPNGTTNSIQNFEPGKGYFLKK